MRSALKAVLFDKDGTLIDFHKTWPPICRDLALDLAAGKDALADDMLRQAGLDSRTGQVASGSVLAAGNTRDLIALWFPAADASERRRLAARIDAAFEDGARRRSVPVAGLRSTLDALAGAGLHLGVATSDATASARACLETLGLAARFACVLGYDAVPRPKPAPDMVVAFCEAVGVPPGAIAVVGDSRHDLEMARAAGAGVAIGLLGGTSARADLMPLADVVLNGLPALSHWLATGEAEGHASSKT